MKIKQVAGLLSVNVISIPLSVITSIIITRFLGASNYGSFKFILNLFSLATVIFTFGFFQAGNRALVLNSDIGKARELYGAELIITGLLFLLYAISLCGYAFFDHNINEKGIRLVLLLAIPFSWVFLISKYFEVLFQADNKIRLLANARLFPYLIYFVIILFLYYFLMDYSGNRLVLILASYSLLLTLILLPLQNSPNLRISWRSRMKRE